VSTFVDEVELYVYYKLARRDAKRLREIAARFPQVRLLLKDDGSSSDPPTWMEIHTGPLAETGERAMAAALEGLIAGTRHVERFRPA